MTETIVHVTTLEEWKSVLDVWFKQGYEWNGNNHDSQPGRFKNYYYEAFRDGCRQLSFSDKKSIYFYGRNGYKGKTIEYSEFMSQQKDDNKMETYYVTQEQLDLIEELKSYTYPLNMLLKALVKYSSLNADLSGQEEKALLRYIGGDETVEFKVKEPLYRLWRVDDDNDKCYMNFNSRRTPFYAMNKDNAFTAPLEEIKKWQTPAWDIEKVEE